jgi:hypothetical protein
MSFGQLFPKKPAPTAPIPQPVYSPGLNVEKALYVGGLIAAFLNRAADTGGFRGAIPAHPHMEAANVIFGNDEGTRTDYGLTAIANAKRASITVAGALSGRLGFLGFAPLHRQANGYEPDWSFEDPNTPMRARCTIIGVTFDVACNDNPDRSATITLTLVT